MHDIITTEGIVLKSFPRREADRFYMIFSRELGVIYVSAQGIRKGHSKLSHAIDDFAHGSYSLVKGKEAWRLVGAEIKKNLFRSVRSKQVFARLRNILSLIADTVDESVDIRTVFDKLLELSVFLEDNAGKPKLVESAELLFLSFFLDKEGRMQKGALEEGIIAECSFSEESLRTVLEKKDDILAFINGGIAELSR